MGGVVTLRGNGIQASRSRWTRAVPVLLVIAALVASCATPVPVPVPAPTGVAVVSPSASGSLPQATPGVTPLPTATPDPADWAALHLPPLVQVATLEATQAVAAGALPDTAFRLTSLDGSDPAALVGRLTVQPALALRVAKTDGAVAVAQPAAPLRPGQTYRVSLRSADGIVQAAWAVQAVQPLHVVTTIPGDSSNGVPRDTGIEITFDQAGINLAEARAYISIEPRVAGAFVQSGRTIAFAPTDPLRAASLYRVTVKHGLPLHGTSMTLEHDVVFGFETAGGTVPKVRVTFENTVYETGLREAAAIGIRVDRDEEDTTVKDPTSVPVTVHRLPSLDAAVRAWDALRRAPDWATVAGTAPIATAKLPRVLRADLKLRSFGYDGGLSRWVRLPRTLPAGWYVVTMAYGGVPRQTVLQVTDVAVYALVTETRTVVWVNDVGTGRPIRGASAGLLGTSLGRTAANGLLVARTPARILDATEDPGPGVVVVRAGSRGAFDVIGDGMCGKCGGPDRSTSRWLVFQPDRYRYRTNDTINVWGVVRDRATLAVPASAEVRLRPAGDDGTARGVIASATARPDRSGSFLVALRYSDLPNGEYALQLIVDGQVAAERGLTVGPIVKPAWTLALGTARHAVVTGASVRVLATAAFFEGTPVAGARIALASNEHTGLITTDALGVGYTPLTVTPEDGTGQWQVVQVRGAPEHPEEGEIIGSATVAVFRSSVIVKLTSALDGTRLTIAGSVNDVAFSRFEKPGLENLDAVDPYGAVVPGTSVRIAIVEHIPVRVRDGTHYDFITKRVVPTYRYNERLRGFGTRTVTTDSKGRFHLAMTVAGGDHSYELKGSAADASGRRTEEQAWASQNIPETRSDWASLWQADGSPETYRVGDVVRVVFSGGAGRTASSRYLWTVAGGGLRTWSLTTMPRFSLPFRGSYVPGVTIDAVRFTGRGYEAAQNGITAVFRTSGRRVKVTLTSDQARYAPGGHATVTVRTTDQAGKPVAASVFVRVIDEKLYAMGLATSDDPLDTLYELQGSGIIGFGWTHRDLKPMEGGGGDTTGGGGDERGDFRDWLLAKIVHTGADGTASVAFDLSDDLTSWRATGSAVTTSLRAGMGSASLPVGLPFFAEATVAPEYLQADRPIIRLRGYGTGLTTGDQVTFTVSSDTLPLAAVTVHASAFQAAEVPLPALTLGTHRLRIEATTGSGTGAQRDVLLRTFTVVTSRTVQASTVMAPLSGPTVVAGGAGLTTLVLSDAGRGRAVPVLEGLTWSDPLRADRSLASALAGRVLRDDFGVDVQDLEAQQSDLGRFQVDGGIAVVPYGAPELQLSVLAAMAGDPRLDRASLTSWLRDRETTTREDAFWALAGRAASGDGVLPEVRAAGALTDLDVHEQVALALAAMAVGDDGLASRLERAVLDAHGERLGPWARIAVGFPDEDAVLTARLAIVAASLGDPVAAEMDAYVAANPSKTTVQDLERVLAARAWASRVPASSATAYLTMDGTRRQLDIRSSAPVRVVLTPAQVATARLEPGTGAVLVTTTTEQPLDPASLKQPAGQAFARTVTPGPTVDATDVVIVSFSVTLGKDPSDGCWVVTDFAPSGLMPIQGPSELYDEATGETVAISPMQVVGQRVDFCVTRDDQQPTQTLRYAARVVTPGVYRWEASVLQSPLFPELGMIVEPMTFTIRGLSN